MERAEAETETKGAGAATSSNTNRRQPKKRVIHLALGGGSIPLIVLGAQSVCPAIPSMKAFLITFGVIIAMGAILKFASNYPPGNLDLEGQKKFKEEHPVLNMMIKVLEFLNLPVGIWGLVITLSNLDLYGNLCLKDEVCTTCDKSTMQMATITCGIVLAVLILVFVLIAKAIITGKLKKKDDPEEEEETQSEVGEA